MNKLHFCNKLEKYFNTEHKYLSIQKTPQGIQQLLEIIQHLYRFANNSKHTVVTDIFLVTLKHMNNNITVDRPKTKLTIVPTQKVHFWVSYDMIVVQ